MDRFMSAYRRLGTLLSEKRYFVYLFLGVFLLFIGITGARRPDMVTYPQFYAEDGVFWYSEGYNARHFWEPFLVPKQRYFQTISRFGGLLGNMVDIGHAPLVFNAIAILVLVSPALYFLSSRFEKLVPNVLTRLLCAVAYLSLLGTAETHANLTNAQWRLAFLMYLIVIAPASRKIAWNAFDGVMLALAGLSGPFVFFALPVAIVNYYFTSFKGRIHRVVILSVAFLIQIYSYLFIVNDAARSSAPLGMNLVTFSKIVSGNIFIAGIFGTDIVKNVRNISGWDSGFVPVLIAIFGFSLLGYVVLKAGWELRCFIVFAFMIFLAGLFSPQVSLDKPQWEVMAVGSGGRYYLFPTLAWVMSLGWLLLNSERKFFRNMAAALMICLVFIGIPRDFTFSKYRDFQFQRQVSEFKSLDIGQSYTFRIVPKWDMTLVRK
ncbi:MAG TPA: hypothetical protein VN420_02225 [Candidatus Fimivivens sp.]|nr:hypothetical protein [Candidatus Fimivivens sp.]